MQDFRKRPGKGGWRRMALGCAAIVMLAALAALSVRAAYGMYVKFTIAASADEQTQKNLANLEAQEAQVRADVAEVSTPEGIEGQIRERWGLARPGEGEIDLVQSPTSTATSSPQSEGFWAWLMHAFSVF